MRIRDIGLVPALVTAAMSFGPSPALGQAARPSANAAKPAAAAERRTSVAAPAPLTIEQQNALDLLDSLADQARAIDDDAVRIRVVTRLADALWERQPDRARMLYERAFDDVDDLSESSTDPNAAPIGAGLQLRAELISSVYAHDPALAERFTQFLDDDPENFDGAELPFENQTERGSTLLRAAILLAPKNPAVAAQLARQSLEFGVPVEFSSVLPPIAQSDARLAGDLVDTALQSAGRNGSSLVDVWGLTAFLFPGYDSPATRGDFASAYSDLRAKYLEAAYALATRYVNGLASRVAPDGDDFSSVYSGQAVSTNYAFGSQLVPLFDRYAPERASSFRVLVGQLERALPTRPALQTSSSSSQGGDTPEALVAKAEAATDAATRNSLYASAATLTLHRDGYESARSILRKIDDETARTTAMNAIASDAALTAIAEHRFDDARRIAADVPNLQTRAVVYSKLASEATASNDRQQATDALDEAERLLLKGGSAVTGDKAAALVQIADAYALVDDLRGFEVMRTAIDAVNKSVLRVSDSAQPETSATRTARAIYQVQRFDAARGLEELARTDYFRALGLAQSFDSKPLSILAQLGVVKGAMHPRVTAKPAKAPADAGAAPEPKVPVKTGGAKAPNAKPATTEP